jgi:hypothetical protein
MVNKPSFEFEYEMSVKMFAKGELYKYWFQSEAFKVGLIVLHVRIKLLTFGAQRTLDRHGPL